MFHKLTAKQYFLGVFATLGVVLLVWSVLPKIVYKFAPLEWFVDIERITVNRVNDQVLLYTIFRSVNQDVRGRTERELWCKYPFEGKLFRENSVPFEFEKDEFDYESFEIKVDERFRPDDCELYNYKVWYFAIMPDGIERPFNHGNPYYTNNFRSREEVIEVLQETNDEDSEFLPKQNFQETQVNQQSKQTEDRTREQSQAQPQQINVSSSSTSESKEESKDEAEEEESSEEGPFERVVSPVSKGLDNAFKAITGQN